MGIRDRLRKARILAGEEKPISECDRDRMQKAGVATLQRSSTPSQIGFLADSLHSGRLTPEKLRKALGNNAGAEMHKGARLLAKKKKAVTVDALLEEYRHDEAFRNLAAEVGLGEDWFVKLAGVECRRWEAH